MQTSHSFLDVFQQYFSGSIMLLLFVIALIVLIREWNNKKIMAIVSVACVSVMLLYNEVTYQVLAAVGERSTYYRFFWICPIVLVVSYLIVKVLFSGESGKRILLTFVLGLLIVFFSARQVSDWTHFPENIYQLDEDVIQVADAVLELTGGEPTYLIDNGDLSNTIRQYDSRINFTDIEVIPLDVILRGYTTNILGRDAIDAIWNNRSRYLVLKKEEVIVYKVLENAGITLAAETDNYNIYSVDYNKLYEDWIQCGKLTGEFINQATIEYIPIKGLQGEYEYIYISDFGQFENQELYHELVAKISLRQPDGIIINDQLSENANWYLQYEELLDELQIPYYCNTQEFQVIEQAEFDICMLDNKDGVSDEEWESFQEMLKANKPIVLVLSSRLEDKNDKLYSILTEENLVVQILSAQKGEYTKEVLGEKILQYATPVDENQVFNVINIKGLEAKNE